jgi:hypothetical protein
MRKRIIAICSLVFCVVAAYVFILPATKDKNQVPFVVEKVPQEENWKEARARAERAGSYGFSCPLVPRTACESIIAAVERNTDVAMAIKRTSSKVPIKVAYDEKIYLWEVRIKGGTPEKKIIAVMNRAFEERHAYDENVKFLREFGVKCDYVYSEHCAAVAALVKSNTAIRALFVETNSQGIKIGVKNHFDAYLGTVWINGHASARKIIKFFHPE